MLSNLSLKDIILEVVSIDYGILATDEVTKNQNTTLLSSMTSGGQIVIKHAETDGELLGMFSAKEVTSTTMYKGPLSLGGDVLNFNVKVYKKVSRALIPTLQQYSDR